MSFRVVTPAHSPLSINLIPATSNASRTAAKVGGSAGLPARIQNRCKRYVGTFCQYPNTPTQGRKRHSDLITRHPTIPRGEVTADGIRGWGDVVPVH